MTSSEQLPLWPAPYCQQRTIADQVEEELEQEATPLYYELLNEEANRRAS